MSSQQQSLPDPADLEKQLHRAKRAHPIPKPQKNKRVKGLRKPQIKILKAMARHPNQTLLCKPISKISGVAYSIIQRYLGSGKLDVRVANEDKWGFLSLVSLKLVSVKLVDADGDGRLVGQYKITKKGVEKAKEV